MRAIDGDVAKLEVMQDFRSERHAVWGITARNREQNFALNLLLDPDIDFVTILGPAGTGKTLLTLAAGLAQTLETNRFSEIIMTRVTIPLGEDIGFLPGTEEEKMEPWMGALMDNLEVLTQGQEGGSWGRAATKDLLRNRIKIRSLNFMRGRTFLNRYLILDEAQNLTPKQMKALVTRAGPGTKLVCLGNIAQIDTPYLTETTSGLTYVVNRFRGWQHYGHVTLVRGERSRLADFASEDALSGGTARTMRAGAAVESEHHPRRILADARLARLSCCVPIARRGAPLAAAQTTGSELPDIGTPANTTLSLEDEYKIGLMVVREPARRRPDRGRPGDQRVPAVARHAPRRARRTKARTASSSSSCATRHQCLRTARRLHRRQRRAS